MCLLSLQKSSCLQEWPVGGRHLKRVLKMLYLQRMICCCQFFFSGNYFCCLPVIFLSERKLTGMIFTQSGVIKK